LLLGICPLPFHKKKKKNEVEKKVHRLILRAMKYRNLAITIILFTNKIDAEINIKTTVHATVASFSNNNHTINRHDIQISQRGTRYVNIYFLYF